MPGRGVGRSGAASCWRVLQVLELEPADEAEAFLRRLLEHRSVVEADGTACFEMLSTEHMRVFLEYAVPLFGRHRDARAGLEEWEHVRPVSRVLIAAAQDHATWGELRGLRNRLRELEDEAAILRKEAEILEAQLKARIGEATGIAGVATWESNETPRRFDVGQFTLNEPRHHEHLVERFPALDVKTWRLREPALYREVTTRFPTLDTAAWRAGDRQLYEEMRKRYYTSTVCRRFVLSEG